MLPDIIWGEKCTDYEIHISAPPQACLSGGGLRGNTWFQSPQSQCLSASCSGRTCTPLSSQVPRGCFRHVRSLIWQVCKGGALVFPPPLWFPWVSSEQGCLPENSTFVPKMLFFKIPKEGGCLSWRPPALSPGAESFLNFCLGSPCPQTLLPAHRTGLGERYHFSIPPHASPRHLHATLLPPSAHKQKSSDNEFLQMDSSEVCPFCQTWFDKFESQFGLKVGEPLYGMCGLGTDLKTQS